jgi:hypothetical protein
MTVKVFQFPTITFSSIKHSFITVSGRGMSGLLTELINQLAAWQRSSCSMVLAPKRLWHKEIPGGSGSGGHIKLLGR